LLRLGSSRAGRTKRIRPAAELEHNISSRAAKHLISRQTPAILI
jgi:hypothetical protein